LGKKTARQCFIICQIAQAIKWVIRRKNTFVYVLYFSEYVTLKIIPSFAKINNYSKRFVHKPRSKKKITNHWTKFVWDYRDSRSYRYAPSRGNAWDFFGVLIYFCVIRG